MIQEDFLGVIDDSLAHLGYSDRSSFIRDAVRQRLERDGVPVTLSAAIAPSRTGKGGRKKKPE